MDLIAQYKNGCQKTIESLKIDLKSIRTGRASPSLIENIAVDAYGGNSKLKILEMATITTEGPSALLIVPFDLSTMQDIEKAILKSPLGMSPLVQGNRIIIKIPPLSAEQREKFIKIVAEKVEEKRVVLRSQRDSVRKELKGRFENKEFSEDEKFRLEKEIDQISQKYTEEIQTIREAKINDIREI